MKNLPDGFCLKSGSTKFQSSSLIRRVIDILENLPKKELVTTNDLAGILGVRPDTVRGEATDPLLAPYRYKHTSGVLWGSKKTIAELRARMEME
jgi:hypothetical protein